ncbi:hypothetical protein OD350_29230 (plasmid) [Clostridium beijerinckii]|uniref:hypothetical protein n=1 Tax=Clostridium beijerinckii TaxID=1520 RepID=UPI002226995E|nr:hypothetical protein [Clostridium beijerinckii]UYZ38973.1 hypothetical protein OD350_29230 [Clostridium beijerinckii]
MATKLYNKHLNDIMDNSKNYYILDTYIALAHMSMQINDKFCLQTYSESISNLVNLVKRYVKGVSYGAIRNAITELMDLDILMYDTNMDSYILNGMENMLKKKKYNVNDMDSSKYVGYTNIQELFFLPRFTHMKYREKRLLIYIFQLADSKANKRYGLNYICNLDKKSTAWLKVLKTKCEYYARNTLKNFLQKNEDLFENTSNQTKFEYAPKKVNNLRFSFNLSPLKNKFNKDGIGEGKDENIVIKNNPGEYSYLVSRALFLDVKLSKTQIMHIIRAAITLPIWSYKEDLIDSVIHKLKLSEDDEYDGKISSLPAYLFGITKRIIKEHKKYLELKEKIINEFNSTSLQS